MNNRSSCDYNLIFLVEEPSMKKLLDILLPRIFDQTISFKCIPHEGKQDLEKSIPRKLKAWNKLNQDTKFIIIRDQDSGDCLKVKKNLMDLCTKAGRKDVIIRIVCRELESWFLGDLAAVEKALYLENNKLSKFQNKTKYRNPDKLNSAKQELKKITPLYQPNSKAGKIAQYLEFLLVPGL